MISEILEANGVQPDSEEISKEFEEYSSLQMKLAKVRKLNNSSVLIPWNYLVPKFWKIKHFIAGCQKHQLLESDNGDDSPKQSQQYFWKDKSRNF